MLSTKLVSKLTTMKFYNINVLYHVREQSVTCCSNKKNNIPTQLSADDIKKFTTQLTASAGLNIRSTLQPYIAMSKHDEASYISILKTDDSSRKPNFNKATLNIQVFCRIAYHHYNHELHC